jgi:protein SCO1
MKNKVMRTQKTKKPESYCSAKRIVGTLAIALAVALQPVLTRAQLSVDPGQPAGVSPSLFKQVRFDQRLGQQIPLDLSFLDEQGHSVTLRRLFGNRPVVLTLAYYRCPMLCTLVLDGLVRALRQSNLEIGKDYSVITVSFDPTDTPALAATKHEFYSVQYARPGAATGWHFLTGKEPQIRQLADAVGFHYAYDPTSKQYVHASGVMILTQRGVLSQYSYGVRFAERDLRLGLVRASQNQIGTLVDQVLLYCCQYDPKTGKYDLWIAHSLKLGGAVTLLTLGLVIGILIRKENYGSKQNG